MLALLKEINKKTDEPIKTQDHVLAKLFDRLWDDLAADVHRALETHKDDKLPVQRDVGQILEDLLDRTRAIEQELASQRRSTIVTGHESPQSAYDSTTKEQDSRIILKQMRFYNDRAQIRLNYLIEIGLIQDDVSLAVATPMTVSLVRGGDRPVNIRSDDFFKEPATDLRILFAGGDR